MRLRGITEQVFSVTLIAAAAALQPVVWILAQKRILDSILEGGSLTSSWAIGLGLLVVAGVALRWVSTTLTERRLVRLRQERSELLIRSALTNGAARGEETAAAEDELSLVESLTERWDRPRIAFIREMILALGTYLAAGWIHPFLPIVGVFLLGANVLTVRRLSVSQSRLVDQDRRSTAKFAASYRRLVEAGSNLRTLGRQRTGESLFSAIHEPFIVNKQAAMLDYSKLTFYGQSLYAVEKLLLVGLSVLLFMAGQISGGGLIVSVFLVPMMAGCLVRLNESVAALYSASDLLAAYKERVRSRRLSSEVRVHSMDWGWHVSVPVLSLPEGRVLARGLEFDLRRGELILLRGPNGVGKTCLLDEVFYALREARVDVKYVDQAAVLPQGDLADALAWGVPMEHANQNRLTTLLPETILNRHALTPGSTSAGEREAVLLVRNLLADPDVLLLDEAMRHLDARSRGRMLREIQRQSKAAVLVVAHDISVEDTAHFDRVLTMSPDGIGSEA